MSLRAFHIIFIIVTVVLSVYVTVWGVREYVQERNATALAVALLFLAAGICGVIYGRKAFVKLKELP